MSQKFRMYMMYMAVQKSVTIREDQEEYVQDQHLNLSRFLQAKLDECIATGETEASNQNATGDT